MSHHARTSSASATQCYRGEPESQRVVARWLEAQGIALAERVVCAVGTSDIATAGRSTIYEIKHQLVRANLFFAVGQVLLYRQCLNPETRVVITGYVTTHMFALHPLIEALDC